MANLNGLDYVLLIVIGFSTLSGFTRGLVKQVFDLLAWVLSIYFAFALGPRLGAELNRLFSLESLLNKALGPIWGNFSVGSTAVNVLGFILVLIIVRLLVDFIANVVDFMARLPIISTFNRLGGAGLGLLKGLAIVFVIATLIKALPTGEFTPYIEGSKVIGNVLKISPTLYEYIRELIVKVKVLV